MQRRPWGWFITLIHLPFFWVKVLRVHGRTSLQSHRLRFELHISSRGIKYIRPWQTHRLFRGWYLELAWGEVNEEDIIRYEDDYGRE